MSDTVGHDGPSGAGDDGPGVITVNGLRMWVADNVTVASPEDASFATQLASSQLNPGLDTSKEGATCKIANLGS